MITMMPTQAPAPAPPRPAGQVNDLLPLGDWVRHHSLRSWPVLLFLALICVPSIALLILGPNPSASTFDHVAWIFAAYFAIAWLLLLGLIIRPEHVSRPVFVLVTAIALATQVPLAVTLEADLHANTAGLGPSIYSVGLPEELAKAIPVLAVALICRLFRRRALTPRDYLFLGAVSGLVFGASEVVHYFTVNGVAQYFIGLAASGRHKWYAVGWIGLVVAAILHGLNDWSRVNGHWLWIVITLVSGVLFLGYAKVGSRGDRPVPAESVTPLTPAGPPVAPAGRPVARPWWEH
jgi:RsiW-degrading membrane proteinase PrsW (M82 family)